MAADRKLPAHEAAHPAVPPYGGTPEEWKQWADALWTSAAMGLECEEIEAGRARLRLVSSPWPLNPNGGVFGGLLPAAADQVAGIVACTVLEPGTLPVTATLNTEFFRAAPPPLTLDGHVTRRGRSIVFVQIEITDAAGAMCARCTGAMSVRPAAAVLE